MSILKSDRLDGHMDRQRAVHMSPQVGSKMQLDVEASPLAFLCGIVIIVHNNYQPQLSSIMMAICNYSFDYPCYMNKQTDDRQRVMHNVQGKKLGSKINTVFLISESGAH